MSFWTNIRDQTEGALFGPFKGDSARKITNGPGGLGNKIDNSVEGAFNKITGRPSSDEKRNQQYAINDQIKAYKDQTAITQQEINTVRDEQNVEKRRVNEKQIRSLRNNFRPAGGFLNNKASLGNSGPVNDKLGS